MDYQFLRDAYTGQGGYADGSYLVRHPRESDDKYKRRKELAWYPNYTKKIVNSFLGHLFRKPAERDLGDHPLFELFCDDVDRGGRRITRYMRNAFRLALNCGTVFIIVDKPQEAATSRADEIEKRLYPYLTMRLPEHLQAWSLGENGHLDEITFAESRMDSDGESDTVYRTFTRMTWKVSEDLEGEKVIEQGGHNLGVCPVVPLHCDEPLEQGQLLATPWTYDLAKANRNLFNQVSEHQDILRSQTFSILTLPARTREEAQAFAGMSIGTDNALAFNPEGGGRPEFVSPSDGPAASYLDSMRECVKTIYRMACLEFAGGGEASGERRSGVAMAFHFQEAGRLLSEFAAQIEVSERRIAYIVHLWMGAEFKGHIAYPRSFDLVDLAEELKNALDSISLDISPTYNKEVKKKVTRHMLSEGVSDATLAQIDDEIDRGETDPYQTDRTAEELGAE